MSYQCFAKITLIACSVGPQLLTTTTQPVNVDANVNTVVQEENSSYRVLCRHVKKSIRRSEASATTYSAREKLTS